MIIGMVLDDRGLCIIHAKAKAVNTNYLLVLLKLASCMVILIDRFFVALFLVPAPHSRYYVGLRQTSH